MKTLPSVTAAVMLAVGAIAARADVTSDQRQVSFVIESQTLAEALDEWAKQTGYQIFVPNWRLARRLPAPVLRGNFNPRAALEKLLDGSPLTWAPLKERGVVVREKPRAPPPRETARARDKPPPARAAQTRPGALDAGGTGVEEVVVTARKRSERLQDTPVPVSTFNAAVLTGTNQLRVEDYYMKIPGLSLSITGNGNQPAIAIRGITTGGDTNPTVGVVVDEVSYGASAVVGPNVISIADIDPGDLARVEVLRGPQGTLYGAASIGGLIKFVTIDPSTEALTGRVQIGSTSIEHADNIGYSVRGNVNIPFGDTFAMRLSGFTLEDPGYIDNIESGERDVNVRESAGGRVSALWRPSDAFSLKLSALIQSSDREGSGDVNPALGEFRHAYLPGTGVYSRDTQAYSATMIGTVGAVELTSATGYSVDESFDSLDVTSVRFVRDLAQAVFGLDRVVTDSQQTVRKFTQEVRAAIPLGSRLDWQLGGFFTRERVERSANNLAAEDSGARVGSVGNTLFGPADYRESALFSSLTIGLTDRWDVQLGGRYSHASQDIPLVFTGPAALDVFGEDPHFAPPLDSTNESFTYLVTPRWRVSPDLMVYARLASGYRPGGPNYTCGFPGVPCTFDPDKTQNYELGMKGNTWGGSFSFDVSLYDIEWDDIQVSGILTPDLIDYTDNVSRARSRGAELAIESRPLQGTRVSAWAAYSDPTLRADFPALSLGAGHAGDRLPATPRLSGSVSIEQEMPLRSGVIGRVGGTVSYVGERMGRFQFDVPGVGTTPRETFGSYALLDLHAGVAYDTWDVSLFINNVADERAILREGADSNFGVVTYIQPRTLGLSFSKSL